VCSEHGCAQADASTFARQLPLEHRFFFPSGERMSSLTGDAVLPKRLMTAALLLKIIVGQSNCDTRMINRKRERTPEHFALEKRTSRGTSPTFADNPTLLNQPHNVRSTFHKISR
jgi:hypothetical protein